MVRKDLKKYSVYTFFLMMVLSTFGFVTTKDNVNSTVSTTGAKKYKEFVKRVLSMSDTYVEFDMVESYDISNCRVVCPKNGVTLKYNPKFLSEAEKGFGFSENKIIDWVTQGILAHEAGHIALNHCKKHKSGSKQAEIEADLFMGKTLRMLGANLTQAQSCLYIPEVEMIKEGNYNYPSQAQRLANVKKGWKSVIKVKTDDYDYTGEKELTLARRYYLAGGKRNFKKSFELFYKNKDKKYFTHNDMYVLGVMYLKGRGTRKNFNKSLGQLKKSYILGNQRAYHLYRLMYY